MSGRQFDFQNNLKEIHVHHMVPVIQSWWFHLIGLDGCVLFFLAQRQSTSVTLQSVSRQNTLNPLSVRDHNFSNVGEEWEEVMGLVVMAEQHTKYTLTIGNYVIGVVFSEFSFCLSLFLSLSVCLGKHGRRVTRCGWIMAIPCRSYRHWVFIYLTITDF